MIVQYSGSYSNPPSDVLNLIANKCSLLDSYIVMQTGQYEYKAIVYNNVSKKGEEYTIERVTGGNSNYYRVTSQSVDSFEYSVANEYYVYSNDGIGKALTLPVVEGAASHALVIICCVLLFAVVFKGALFKCLRPKR